MSTSTAHPVREFKYQVNHQPLAGAVLYARDLDRVGAFYAGVLGFEVMGGDDEHTRLESPAFQLVILRMPPPIAATIAISVPPVRRADTAVKLMFVVPSLADVRRAAPALGGGLNEAESEWDFEGHPVCDGFDPEGNVVQFRQRTG